LEDAHDRQQGHPDVCVRRDPLQSAIANPQSKGGAFGSWEQVGVALKTHALLMHQP
jgi:hypothetical protein